MWTKIKKGSGRKRGRSGRDQFGVVSRGRTLALLIPAGAGFAAGEELDFYEADGAIGFKPSNSGYKIFKVKRETLSRCTMPSRLAAHFPHGTTDIEVTRDGDMYVIDLSQFPSQEAAQ